MTPRRRALLIVGLALILIALIVTAIIMLTRVVTPAVQDPPVDDPAPTEIEEPLAAADEFENPLIVREAVVAPGATAGQQMAELFAERYGSYSNQGDYQNLRDLLPVMTPGYRASTEAFLETASTAPGATFEGVTSVKISTDVRSVTDASAVIAVTLQQEKRSGTSAPTTGYRTLRMELTLIGEDWRVDAAAWED